VVLVLQGAKTQGGLALRGGTGTDELEGFDVVGKLCALPELSADNGINVSLSNKGAGWRRPSFGDEVVLSYVGRELGRGRQFERCDEKKAIRLGQGFLPTGLERAIVLRFFKGAQGVVTLAPAHAFGQAGCPPLVEPNTVIEYTVTLWDWNNIWETPDSNIKFRGLGQPANHSAPAGDSGGRFALLAIHREAAPSNALCGTTREESSHVHGQGFGLERFWGGVTKIACKCR
jgi:hypothetical protein